MDTSTWSTAAYGSAPEWAERTRRVKLDVGNLSSLMMLRIPDECSWALASKVEADAIADPASLLGRLMRPHAGLLPLPYVSAN